MRGLYSATYLNALTNQMAKKFGKGQLDIGASFDLITGTSTGGILACALAIGTPMSKAVELYKEHGSEIFPLQMPKSFWGVARQWLPRPKALAAGEAALKEALIEVFGTTRVKDVLNERHIALAIPAVEMSRHAGWVFKTAHLANSSNRDDDYTLVDVCLATSAAPLFRSMANIRTPDDSGHAKTFVDGGLWANDPILIGLIDALEMAQEGQSVEIYCLGTCKRPEGETISPADRHRSFKQWRFGAAAASLSIDAQEFTYPHMARMLAKHVKNDVSIVRFPSEPVSAQSLQYLELDATSEKAISVLQDQAYDDMSVALSRVGNSSDEEGQWLKKLFEEMREVTT